MLAADGWELPEKFIEGVACLDVIEQRLHRHARANEHGRSAQNLRVAVYDERFTGHDHTSITPAGTSGPVASNSTQSDTGTEKRSFSMVSATSRATVESDDVDGLGFRRFP